MSFTLLSNPSTCWVTASCVEPEACCSGVTITVGRAHFSKGRSVLVAGEV